MSFLIKVKICLKQLLLKRERSDCDAGYPESTCLNLALVAAKSLEVEVILKQKVWTERVNST